MTLKTVKVGAAGNSRWRSSRSPTPSTAPAKKLPQSPKECLMVGGVKYGYGIGQLEVTVKQWVTFLNTADPTRARSAPALRSERELLGLAQVRPDRLLLQRRQGPPLHGGLSGMGRQALRLRQLPARRPLRQLALQRPAALQAASGEGGFRYVTYRVRLSRRTETRDVRPCRRQAQRPDPGPQDRLRDPQPERVDQGGLLRPQRRRHLLLLEVPDQPRRFRRRHRDRPQVDDARSHHGDVTNSATQPLATYHASEVAAPSWCPAASPPKTCSSVNPLRDRPHRPTTRPTRAASARSARRRPPRRGARSTRAATRSSGPTRSPRRRREAAVDGSGGGCTAASPTLPPTSSGSRRSACSPRTTRSSPPPTRGSASASAVLGNLKVAKRRARR